MSNDKEAKLTAALGKLEEERDELNRELAGIKEMLAFVLYEVAEPVVVAKESLVKGLPNDMEIRIDDDLQRDAFVFSLGSHDE